MAKREGVALIAGGPRTGAWAQRCGRVWQPGQWQDPAVCGAHESRLQAFLSHRSAPRRGRDGMDGMNIVYLATLECEDGFKDAPPDMADRDS